MQTAFDAYRRQPGPETQAALLAACRPSVVALCRRVLGHPEDAEDAAQSVLLQLAGALPRLNDVLHLRRWLHQASFHVALNLKKERAARAGRERRAATTPAAAREEAVDAVHEELARLEPELRALVVGHFIEQRSLQTLGAERGCSAVAVWKKLEKAKATLRRRLATASLGALAALDALMRARRQTPTLVPAVFGACIVAASVGVLVWGAARRLEAPPERATAPAARTGAAPPAPTAAPPITAVVPPETSELAFHSLNAFRRAVDRACAIVDDRERWAALRRLGIELSDDAFARTVPPYKRRGTYEFIQQLTRSVWRAWATDQPHAFMRRVRALPDVPDEKAGFLKGYLLLMPSSVATSLAQELTTEEGREDALRTLAMMDHPARFAPELLAQQPSPEKSDAIYYVMGKWAESAPRDAAAFAGSLPEGRDRDYALRVVANAWARTQPREAIAWARTHPAPARELDSPLASAIEGARERDPAAAVEAALEDGSRQTSWPLTRALTSWELERPGEAAAFLNSRPMAADLRRSLEEALMFHLALRDPDAAMALARRIPDAKRRDTSLLRVVTSWAEASEAPMSEVRARIETLPSGKRMAALRRVAEIFAETDPAAAAELVASVPGAETKLLREKVARGWAKRDPAGGTAWALGLPEGEARDEALLEVAHLQALEDPAKANALLGHMSSDLARDKALGKMARIVAHLKDPSLGTALARRISTPEVRDEALRETALALGMSDFEGALGLVSDVSAPERRAEALKDVVSRSRIDDYPAAARRFAKAPNAMIQRNLAMRWAAVDGPAALAWALGLPSSVEMGLDFRDNAAPRPVDLRGVVGEHAAWAWAQKDTAAAERWIRAVAVDEPTRERLLSGVARARK